MEDLRQRTRKLLVDLLGLVDLLRLVDHLLVTFETEKNLVELTSVTNDMVVEVVVHYLGLHERLSTAQNANCVHENLSIAHWNFALVMHQTRKMVMKYLQHYMLHRMQELRSKGRCCGGAK